MSFQIRRGANKTLIRDLTDQSGAAIDVTTFGTVVTLDVGRRLGVPQLSLTLTKVMSVPGTPSNRVSAVFVPADTSALLSGDYWADIRVAYFNGEVLAVPPFVFSITDGVRA